MSVNEGNLKLTGNKIKLVARSRENQGKASSRCALLGRDVSRPVSAVPLLNLNYVNEFDFPRNTRRPLSADFPMLGFKNSTYPSLMNSDSKYGSDGTLESSEISELEAILPSSKLLHNLLSEQLYSWRDGIRCKPSNRNKMRPSPPPRAICNDSNNETPSVGSDTSSAESDIIKPKTTPKIIELTSEETDKKENETERIANTMALVPGLKTKPPLPKKPLDSNGKSGVRRNNSPSGREPRETNLERIVLGTPNQDLLPPEAKPLENKELQSIQEIPNSREQEENMESSRSTSDSNEQLELKFQNWFQEETANDAVLESELNTDLSLRNLKMQHQKAVTRPETPTTKLPEKPTINTSKSGLNPKCVNFNNFELTEVKRSGSTAKNFIKQNIKLASCKASRHNLDTTEEIKPKPKFVPTQMKAYADCSVDTKTHDVESWMSSFQEARTSKPNFLDCLNKIDELQESCQNVCVDDIPERDETTTNRSDSSTYDDIISILQVLEEEDKKSQTKIESIKEIVNEFSVASEKTSRKNASSDEFSANDSSTESEEAFRHCKPKKYKDQNFQANKISGPLQDGFSSPGLQEANSHKHIHSPVARSPLPQKIAHSPIPQIAVNGFLENSRNDFDREPHSRQSTSSSANLNDIFSFLDEVDRNCVQSLVSAKERVQSTTKVLENSIQLDTVPKIEELLAYTNVELAHHIIDLTLRLKEKSSSIALLQRELSGLREQVTKMTKDTADIAKHKLKTQKDDYENIVKRHQKFIDQLISDKKTLNQQCESLVHEMKILEDRFNSNMKAVEHKHRVEVQKLKETQAAGEKIRRERWIDTKTQKIKELTVKGLEPELDKMAARHQQELTDLRSLHKREIEDLELRGARKMQQQCEMVREQLIADREKALTQERESFKQRYEQLVESEEKNYQEQRRKLLAEHAKRIAECEERENNAVVEKERAIKQAQCEFEDKLQAAMRRHTNELSVLKETTELEIEAFRNNYKKQIALQLTEKEAMIRERSRRDRDKEIEAVIDRLETESSECKKIIEQSTENRLKRLREKYEKEIKDLESSEMEATSKYTETKSKLLETENSIMCLKASAKQMEIQLHESKELAEKLSSERNHIKEIVRDEMRNEIQALEKEVQTLKDEKDKELQQVYGRVRLAVARKDETISELTRDHKALQEKCVYLENMLEQQRKEYLIK